MISSVVYIEVPMAQPGPQMGNLHTCHLTGGFPRQNKRVVMNLVPYRQSRSLHPLRCRRGSFRKNSLKRNHRLTRSRISWSVLSLLLFQCDHRPTLTCYKFCTWDKSFLSIWIVRVKDKAPQLTSALVKSE